MTTMGTMTTIRERRARLGLTVEQVMETEADLLPVYFEIAESGEPDDWMTDERFAEIVAESSALLDRLEAERAYGEIEFAARLLAEMPVELRDAQIAAIVAAHQSAGLDK